jgi:hypothetical protein
MFEQN